MPLVNYQTLYQVWLSKCSPEATPLHSLLFRFTRSHSLLFRVQFTTSCQYNTSTLWCHGNAAVMESRCINNTR